MLRITIELLPHGDSGKAVVLHRGAIANDLTGTKTKGNYNFCLSKKGSGDIYKTGQIKGFSRKKHTAWRLLYLVLKEAFEGES